MAGREWERWGCKVELMADYYYHLRKSEEEIARAARAPLPEEAAAYIARARTEHNRSGDSLRRLQHALLDDAEGK